MMRRWIGPLAIGWALGSGCAAPGASAPPPAPPQYTSALAEAVDLPKQMEAQVDWALAPIQEANAVAGEIETKRAELGVDPATFNAACRAAFEGKPAPQGAADLSPEQREQLDALTKKLGQVGADLRSVPKRASAAGLAMFKLGMKTPLLVKKAADEVKANPVLGAKSLPAVLRLPKDLKQLGPKLKKDMKEAPQNAIAASKKILAALAEQKEGDEGAAAPVVAEVDEAPAEAEDETPAEDDLEEWEPLPEPEEDASEPEPMPAEEAEPETDDVLVVPDEPAKEPRPLAPSKPGEDRPRVRGMQVAGYSLLGVGVGVTVGLVTGGYVRGMKGYAGYVTATTPEGELASARQYDSGRSMIIAGAVTGTLLTATGITLVVIDAVQQKKRNVAVAPAVGGVVLTGKF